MNLTDLYDAILNGKLDRAVAVTNEAISEGVLPNEIITNYMIKAMEELVIALRQKKCLCLIC